MTLVLSANFMNWASVQVTDRRVSWSGSDTHWDYANKQVVVKCLDAMLLIGFSGAAHVGDETTDDWIVRHIWGKRRGEVPTGMVIGASDFPWLRLDQVLHRVHTALGRAAARNRDLRLDLSMTGHREVRPNTPIVLPFWVSMIALAGLTRTKVSGKYEFGTDGRVHVRSWGSGHVLAKRCLDAAIRRVPDIKGPADLEQLMVHVVRQVSARDASVGPDAMVATVTTNPMIKRDATIRFAPAPSDAPSADYYTPWVLAPGTVAPPTVTIATGAFFQGAITTFRSVPMYPFRVGFVAPRDRPLDGAVVARVVPATRTPRRLPTSNSPTSSGEIWATRAREHARRVGRNAPETR